MIVSFLNNQTDYLLFLHGMIWGLLAATAASHARHESRRMDWGWLAVFGFAMGLTQFWALIAPLWSPPQISVYAMLAVRGVAFAALIECARSSLARAGRAMPGRWIVLLFVAVASLGAWWGSEALVDYVLGVPAACGMAVALIMISREHFRGRMVLRIAGVGFAIYGLTVALGVPGASWVPASFFNEGRIGAWLGIPYVTLRVVGALMCALPIARHLICACPVLLSEAMSKGVASRFCWIVPVLMLIAAIGWIAVQRVGDAQSREMEGKIRLHADLVAASINFNELTQLTGNPRDVGTPQFEELRARFTAMDNSSSSARFAYIFGMRGDDIIFLLDSEPDRFHAIEDSTSLPGLVYDEATPALRAMFVQPTSMIEGPVADRWGEWVSALKSITDPATGKVVAVVGVDLDAREWRFSVERTRFYLIVSTALFMALVVLVFASMRMIERSRAGIARSEFYYRLLFDQMNDAVFLVDTETGVIIDVNAKAEALIKRPRAELVGMHQSALHPKDELEKYRAIFAAHVSSGKADAVAAEIVTSAGAKVPVEISVSLLELPDNRVVLLGVFRDVSERRRAEEQLEKKMAEIEHLNEFMMGREHRVIELKKEVNEVLAQLGQKPRYGEWSK